MYDLVGNKLSYRSGVEGKISKSFAIWWCTIKELKQQGACLRLKYHSTNLSVKRWDVIIFFV